jgi:tRNA(His) guanylyltransferase
MKFDDLDRQMRRFEASLDQFAPQDHYIVARLDGRGFTKLTKETLAFKRPFDTRFHEAMVQVCEHLMGTGLRIALCYTQSDEISLLFASNENAFNRKTRKLTSVLAGEASGVFSLALGTPAAFDCRICPLPSLGDAVDYFRWRTQDATRNALSAYCYWTLRERGIGAAGADLQLAGLSSEAKRAFLQTMAIDFDDVAEWERRGAMLVWKDVSHAGKNPITGAVEETIRRRLAWLAPVPEGGDIARLVEDVLTG